MSAKTWPITDMERRGEPLDEVVFFADARHDGLVHVRRAVRPGRAYRHLPDHLVAMANTLGMGDVVAYCGRTVKEGQAAIHLYVSAFPDDHLCQRCYDRWPFQTRRLYEHAQGYT